MATEELTTEAQDLEAAEKAARDQRRYKLQRQRNAHLERLGLLLDWIGQSSEKDDGKALAGMLRQEYQAAHRLAIELGEEASYWEHRVPVFKDLQD